jgi:hypothetical protein
MLNIVFIVCKDAFFLACFLSSRYYNCSLYMSFPSPCMQMCLSISFSIIKIQNKVHVWYHNEYVRIMVTHRDFSKLTVIPNICKKKFVRFTNIGLIWQMLYMPCGVWRWRQHESTALPSWISYNMYRQVAEGDSQVCHRLVFMDLLLVNINNKVIKFKFILKKLLLITYSLCQWYQTNKNFRLHHKSDIGAI